MAEELAKLLNQPFRQGDAAKALALLGAKEYKSDIAEFLGDGDPLVRCDALIALGILDAQEYAQKMAAHLEDQEQYVRFYAAVALVLIWDQSGSTAIRQALLSKREPLERGLNSRDPLAQYTQYIRLHPVVAARQRQLALRAAEAWDRLIRSDNRLQDGKANKEQPFLDPELKGDSKRITPNR